MLTPALALALIEQADDAIIAQTRDGTIVAWNRGAERLFGHTAAEMIGGTACRLYPAERRQEESELIARLTAGNQAAHFVSRRIRNDGKPLDVSVTLSPLREARETGAAVCLIARDVTASHQEQLAAALAAAIIEHGDDAIISKSIDGTILSWNHGAARMFGYTAAEMTGQSIMRLFPPDRVREETDLVAKLHQGKPISHFETRRVRKDGAVIDVSVTLSPVRDPSGRIIAVSKIARDITERQQTRELRDKNLELERSNRDLEDFAFIASHDLKTPLSGILCAASWLEEELEQSLSQQSKTLLAMMRTRISRMHTLLDDLLAYSRVGRSAAAAGETRVTDLLSRIVEVLSPPAHLRVRADGDLRVWVKARAELEQVLRNLIDNAVKHHDKPSGEVILSAVHEGDFVTFSVRDDGPGIAPEFHEKVFRLFQTLKRRDEMEGTGMGLAIVKKLVERRHGRISVHSRGDGTGTEFRCQWPAAGVEAPAPEAIHD